MTGSIEAAVIGSLLVGWSGLVSRFRRKPQPRHCDKYRVPGKTQHSARFSPLPESSIQLSSRDVKQKLWRDCLTQKDVVKLKWRHRREFACSQALAAEEGIGRCPDVPLLPIQLGCSWRPTETQK